MRLSLPLTLALAGSGSAQNFVATPKDTKLIPSQNYPGASISYKQTTVCETTPGVKSFSGYVHLPSTLLADVPATYNASIFFWYFQARHDPANAPLSIYIGGGPGTTGMDDSSGFPCKVQPDTNTTVLNEFSWNDKVNMLYIDQPVGTGFSYSTLINGIANLVPTDPATQFVPVEDPSQFVQTNVTTVGATISVPDPSQTAMTTMQAARTMWHFAQVWFHEFAEHKTSSPAINIWTVSYGGYFAPAIFAHFERQNDRIADGTLGDSKAKKLELGTIGLQNACIDADVQGSFYPEFAYNNTYGIQAIPKEIYEQAAHNVTKPGGCRDMIQACRAAGTLGDPLETGLNTTVNEICVAASNFCFNVVQGALTTYSKLQPFDITYTLPTVTPTDYNSPFLNRAWVQAALGVPVNFSLSSPVSPGLFFFGTGDPMRRSMSDLSLLAARGRPIAFVYGDRDYRCNWPGAENVSLSLDFPGAATFGGAGYAPLQTNETHQAGLVRQAGSVSFSRVFQAGHSVAAYQPETVLRIFERTVFGKDVATGKKGVEGYVSAGAADVSGVKNEAPKTQPEPVCLVYSALSTCTENQLEALAAGTAVTKDFVVVEPKPAAAVAGGNRNGKGPEDGKKENGDKSGAGRTGMSLAAAACGILAAAMLI